MDKAPVSGTEDIGSIPIGRLSKIKIGKKLWMEWTINSL
tara:strand:+ start:547 stop:663 length:117 start_codon:yes stop_codon:yes gene_type:complete